MHNKKRGGNPWGNNLEDWLRKIADWSRDHEPHAPITVFLDLKKNLIDENNNPPEQYGLIRFNEQIRKACGDRFITPESFDANTKIKELQNKIIVVLMSFHTLSRKLKEVEQKKPIFFIRPITTLLRWLLKLPQQLVIQPIGAMKTRIAYQKGRIKKDNDFNPLCCVAFNPEDRGIPGFEASLEDKSIFVTAYDKKYATYQGKGKLVRTDYKQKDGKWPRDFPDYVNFPATDTWKKKDKYHEQTKDWVKDKWMKWWSVEAKQALKVDVESSISCLKTQRLPLKGLELSALAAIHIAEYDALRRQIDTYQRHQKEIMNFTFVIFAAMSGIFGVILTLEPNQVSSIPFIFLIFPPVYILLSLLYTDRIIRIICTADYIHNYLRREVSRAVGENIWLWETYKDKDKNTLFSKRFTLILDRVRWLVFLFPSFFAIILFIFYLPSSIDVVLVILLILDIVAISIGILVAFVTEETTGVKDRKLKIFRINYKLKLK